MKRCDFEIGKALFPGEYPQGWHGQKHAVGALNAAHCVTTPPESRIWLFRRDTPLHGPVRNQDPPVFELL